MEDKKKRLAEHAENFWKSRPDADSARVEKWRKLYAALFENERFCRLAEPVTDESILYVNEYGMRYDGVYVFFEAFVRDAGGDEIISGNPMRFPHDPESKVYRRYRSNDLETIFGQPVKLITKVKDDQGIKSHIAQIDESEAVVYNQADGCLPIAPFRYALPYTEAHVFRREDFLFHFPCKPALHFMRSDLNFVPVVKGVNWLLETAHTRPWFTFDPFRMEELGATGSASFGDEHDLEDFDVVFFGDLPRLQQVRDFLIAGTHAGDFRPFVSNFKRRLRVANILLPVKEINGHVVFCSFLCLENQAEDPMHDARIELLQPLAQIEGRVVDDSYNMLSPSRVTLGDLCHVEPAGALDEKGNIDLVLMHGNCRGQFAKGNWIRIQRPVLARIHPVKGDAFMALVSTGWRDADLMYW